MNQHVYKRSFFIILWEIIFGGFLIWVSALMYESSDQIEYDLLSLIIFLFGVFSIITAILQIFRREVLVIDSYGVRVIPNYFKSSVVLPWNEILHVELMRKSNVKIMVFSLKNGRKIQISFAGISSRKTKESIELMNSFMNNESGGEDVSKIYIDKATTSSFGVLLLWLLFQTIAVLLTWLHMLIYSEVIFKGNILSPFFTTSVMTAVFLIVTDLNYWVLFKLGWHSTENGIQLRGSKWSIQLPAFIQNTSDYLNIRSSVSSRAKSLQKIYVITRIILLSFSVGVSAEAAIYMMNFNLNSYFSTVLIIAVVIFLIFIFSMYKQFFAKIFKLKIIQSENSHPHFDDI